MLRRSFLKGLGAVGISTGARPLAALERLEPAAAPSTGAEDRAYWAATMIRVVDPVLFQVLLQPAEEEQANAVVMAVPQDRRDARLGMHSIETEALAGRHDVGTQVDLRQESLILVHLIDPRKTLLESAGASREVGTKQEVGRAGRRLTPEGVQKYG